MELTHVDLSPHDQHILSLCSGGGGLDLGVRLAVPTARTVGYVEIEAYACSLLVAHMEAARLDAAPLYTDLRTFRGRKWRGCVDGIIGGYPCQPFSVAGKRRGTDDPRHLWPIIRRLVRIVRPAWCFFENVANHLRLGFDQVARELHALGYVVAAGLFTAAEDPINACHRRERLLILAVADRERCDGEYALLQQRRSHEDRVEVTGCGASVVQPCRPERGTLSPARDGSSEGRDRDGQVHGGIGESGTSLEDTRRLPAWGSADTRQTESGRAFDQLAGPSNGVDDTARIGWREGRSGGARRERIAASAITGRAMGDTHDARFQGRVQPVLEGPDERAPRATGPDERAPRATGPTSDGLPRYPPGPADVGAWRHVLTIRPDLAPALSPAQQVDYHGRLFYPYAPRHAEAAASATESALRRMVDGVAPRVDRLRLLGNGVVPEQAAYAFITLAADLREYFAARAASVGSTGSVHRSPLPVELIE